MSQNVHCFFFRPFLGAALYMMDGLQQAYHQLGNQLFMLMRSSLRKHDTDVLNVGSACACIVASWQLRACTISVAVVARHVCVPEVDRRLHELTHCMHAKMLERVHYALRRAHACMLRCWSVFTMH